MLVEKTMNHKNAKSAKAYIKELCQQLDDTRRLWRPRQKWWLTAPAALGVGLGLAACGGPNVGSDTSNMEEGPMDCRYLPEDIGPSVALYAAPIDLSELNCSDGNDDDFDGLIDCADPDCAYLCSSVSLYAAPPPMPPEDCLNGVDDDLDGDADCADSDCIGAAGCSGALYAAPVELEICDNCLDDNVDGLFDCADPDCQGYPGCVPPAEDCSNNIDDDFDGQTDCSDSDCVGQAGCVGLMYAAPVDEICGNGVDDDNDGAIECGESECLGAAG